MLGVDSLFSTIITTSLLEHLQRHPVALCESSKKHSDTHTINITEVATAHNINSHTFCPSKTSAKHMVAIFFLQINIIGINMRKNDAYFTKVFWQNLSKRIFQRAIFWQFLVVGWQRRSRNGNIMAGITMWMAQPYRNRERKRTLGAKLLCVPPVLSFTYYYE